MREEGVWSVEYEYEYDYDYEYGYGIGRRNGLETAGCKV